MRIMWIVLACANLLLPVSQAEVLQIPLSQQGDNKLPRPCKGMSKAEVENLFGVPQNQQGPVGQPPISRWTYPDYVVIFEYDHVVHTVLKHKAKVPVETVVEDTDTSAAEPGAEAETPPSP